MSPDSKESTTKPVQRDDDAACGKLWEIYADEAREYDEGLVKSWKEDMDGVLIFSGLYSAVLTAFVIESYKDLEEDPLDVSAEVLKAIYLQQTSPSNTLNLPQPWDDSFTPDPSTLACNYLWFFSLALALICAFLAMFIQQWSRHFTQRISIVRSPTTRARLIQFFYFGLKEHGMHILVDVVPSLLHVSLFCFFGGLAAFLWTVHRPLALLVVALLALLVSVYAVITLLPIIKLSSPYQTPLSSLVWRMLQTCLTTFKRLKQWGRPPPLEPKDVEKGESSAETHSPASDPLAFEHGEEAEATDKLTLHQAMVNHGRRRRQDQEAQSIAWTLKYLSEDDEILPLIEALPVALAQNNQGFHNLDIIIPVLKTTIPYCNLLTRVHSLLIGAEDPWHTKAYRERCRSSVSSFLWTLSRALFSLRHQYGDSGQESVDAESIIFPQEIFWALQARSLSSKPERNHALSIMVLCMLHNCLSLDKTSTGNRRELIETGETIFRNYSHKNESGHLDIGWCIKPEPANPNLPVTRDDIASHLLWTYLQVSGLHFPAGFIDVCDIFRQNGIKPMHPKQGIGDGLLANLAFQLYLLDKAPQPQVTLRELDSIFAVVLQYSGVKDLPGISAYISRRAQCGPWTTAAWREEDLVHLCTLLIQLPSPVYMIPTWADMCRWIIGHTHRHLQAKQVYSLLNHLLHYFDIENHPSLAFFVKLSIVKKYEYTVAHDYSQLRQDVLTQLGSDPFYKGFILCTDLGDLEPYTDSRFRSTVTPRKEEICNGERGVNGSLLMLQALAANPPISDCRQILEFYYFLRFPTDSVTFLARQPLLLERLVQITQKFCVLWASSPSQDLFEVNRMLWRLWRCILSDGPWKDPNPWRELKPTQSSHSRTLQNLQRDPGPWGDPIPWTNPDPRCITKLRPLLEVAEGIISTPSETLDEAKAASGKRQQAGSFTAIDALDPVSEARIVSDHLRSLFASE